jgi:hypothetical protein
MNKGWIWTIVISCCLALFGLIYVCNLITVVDKHELGFVFNRMTGQIEPVPHAGWVVKNPFKYAVHTIDCRPYQVSISANQRILNAKLVKFNSAGLEAFINWHGRSAGNSTLNLIEIMKCYAFDRDEGRDCPFIEVIGQLAPSQTFGTATSQAVPQAALVPAAGK